MTIDEITAEIEKDSVIDQAALDTEALRVPLLHAKYYKIMMEEGRKLRAIEYSFKELRRTRMEYYLGKADDAVYMEEPLNHKVLKADLDVYLESDDKMNQMLAKRDNQKAKVQLVEEYIKTLNNRSFLISNAIAWRKFQNGVS